MGDAYAVLAPVYRQAGLFAESENRRERVFDRLQSDGWLGRRILELGCGIGETACWFGGHGFRITGVDNSAAMIAQARCVSEDQGAAVDWREADIRTFDPGNGYDLVLSFNTLNELKSIRELEVVFQVANRALDDGKMFVFDLMTIRGLAQVWGTQDVVLYDDPAELTVVARSAFSFEASANTRSYMVYHHDGERWNRAEETHILRGYPLHTVGTLLKRSGFAVKDILNEWLDPMDPATDDTGRAVVLAVKENSL